MCKSAKDAIIVQNRMLYKGSQTHKLQDAHGVPKLYPIEAVSRSLELQT